MSSHVKHVATDVIIMLFEIGELIKIIYDLM
jgi:hypothetical protein